MSLARTLVAAALVASLGSARVARADDAPEPTARQRDKADLTHLLDERHDDRDEPWNLYGQLTYISSWKRPFSARYTNLNGSTASLGTDAERSWTASFTLYLGVHLWPGGEAYFVPEVIAERALADLHGLGGTIQNFELQKQGSTRPLVYRSRIFLQHTVGLGGAKSERTSDPMQLGGVADARRIVFRAGSFSIIDFFDKSSVVGDPRRGFFNMAFMTHAAYDFAADARGYSWGAMTELFWDDWAVRLGRFAQPENPNDLPLTFQLDRYYGDQLELEHRHELFGKAGAVRVLGYRNRAKMARFDDALAAHQGDPSKNAAACGDLYNYSSANVGAPDLCWARRPNVKVGIGLNLEQQLTDDLGLFFRAMLSDGQTEVYAFTSTDRSLSLGAIGKGSMWRRPLDVAGVGYGIGGISSAHADYLRAGGVDGFIGDGTIRPAGESVIEAFYSLNVFGPTWVSIDYQHLTHPAFNADRGPIDIFGARLHAEF